MLKPITIDGSVIKKVSGVNAKFIVDNRIGPGAVVEIIRSGGVIPNVKSVISGVEPKMPSVPFRWNETGVNVMLDQSGEQTDEISSTRKNVLIQKLHHFLVTIGVKGVGEATVTAMVENGITNIEQFSTITAAELSYLGPKTSINIANSIKKAFSDITLPVFLAASGMFDRGMGVEKFEKIFKQYPDFLELDQVQSGKIDQISGLVQTVTGFAKKTADIVAAGMPQFMEFIGKLDEDIVINIFTNTEKVAEERDAASSYGSSALLGKGVCLTGFRDDEIKKFVDSNGGKLQTAISGSTNILIIKDATYENKKTEAARAKGITIMTRDDFVKAFM